MDISNLTQPLFNSTGFQVSDGEESPGEFHSGQTVPLSSPATDTLSITQSHLSVARQVMTQQVNIALEINSSTSPRGGFNDSNEYHSSNLVNKVLQKIHDDSSYRDKDGSDDDHQAEVVKSVRLNVDQGFEQSRVILNQIGVMDSSVVNEVDQTQAQVNQAIDSVAKSPASASGPLSSTLSTESASLNTASATRELSTSLQVTTQDGDVVTIDMSRSNSLSAGSFQGSSGLLVYAGSSSESQLSISIQGELSQKESNSIRKVIERVGQLAQKLFNGETADAMEKLSKLNINTEQLSGIALNMSSNFSYTAISAYSQVSEMTLSSSRQPAFSGPGNARPPAPAAAVSTAADNRATTPASEPSVAIADPQAEQQNRPASLVVADIMAETSSVAAEVRSSNSFENPYREMHKLFDQMADLMTHNRQDISDSGKDFIKDLFHGLIDRLEGEDESEDD